MTTLQWNRPAPIISYRWGRWWMVDTKPLSLNILVAPRHEYGILLCHCQTTRDRKLRIDHMARKQHITKQDVEDLKQAFEDLKRMNLINAEVTPPEPRWKLL